MVRVTYETIKETFEKEGCQLLTTKCEMVKNNMNTNQSSKKNLIIIILKQNIIVFLLLILIIYYLVKIFQKIIFTIIIEIYA